MSAVKTGLMSPLETRHLPFTPSALAGGQAAGAAGGGGGGQSLKRGHRCYLNSKHLFCLKSGHSVCQSYGKAPTHINLFWIFRSGQPHNKFSNRTHTHAQDRYAVLARQVSRRVVRKPNIANFWCPIFARARLHKRLCKQLATANGPSKPARQARSARTQKSVSNLAFHEITPKLGVNVRFMTYVCSVTAGDLRKSSE